MFGLSIVSTKEITQLRDEIKGFYDSGNNAENLYLAALAGCTKGLELAPPDTDFESRHPQSLRDKRAGSGSCKLHRPQRRRSHAVPAADEVVICFQNF